MVGEASSQAVRSAREVSDPSRNSQTIRRPAPAQQVEQGHDRPARPRAADRAFTGDGGRFRHRKSSCALLQIL